MRKYKLLSMGAILIASLSMIACSSNTAGSSVSETPSVVSTASSELKDGVYTGKAANAEYGWYYVHSITVEDGKITESKFGYVDENGVDRAENTENNETMKSVTGVSATEAVEQLNNELIEKQDIESVDTVTGATGASTTFISSTKALLEAAKEGNTEPLVFE